MAMNAHGPYLIVCPLSVLANWVNEFAKFAPDIPVSRLSRFKCLRMLTSTMQVLMYHGTPPEREVMRREKMDRSTASQGNKRKKIEGSNAVIPAFPVVSLLVIIEQDSPLTEVLRF